MWINPPQNLTLLLDKRERLQNLYYIIDKNGNQVPFNLNWAQDDILKNVWHQMLILKARQLGVTTFFAINYLDDCFWMPNTNSGIIAHRKEDAEQIFKQKVKFAYDRMPKWTRTFNNATNDRAGELAFANGSNYRVSTGFRSGTYQRLLVSEFGKICAKSPDVATEIVTGSLNTVSKDQIIAIESTAEGREGFFYDYCKEAAALAIAKKPLSAMQKRFFFFPWYLEPSYENTDASHVVTQETQEYFKDIKNKTAFNFRESQMRWYDLKSRDMGDSMKQEYPSTPEEAFEASNEGLYWGKKISEIRAQGHITRVPYQDCSPVHTAFDLGYHDHTCIWFFQTGPGGSINVIDYYEDDGKGSKFYIDFLKTKPYTYGTHILPHDGAYHGGAGDSSWADNFNTLMSGTTYVLSLKGPDAVSPLDGIDKVRNLLGQCYFDEGKCSKGISHLEAYKKEWNDKLGCYRDTPLHNVDSHCADAFRYLAVGIEHVGGKRLTPDKIKEMRQRHGLK